MVNLFTVKYLTISKTYTMMYGCRLPDQRAAVRRPVRAERHLHVHVRLREDQRPPHVHVQGLVHLPVVLRPQPEPRANQATASPHRALAAPAQPVAACGTVSPPRALAAPAQPVPARGAVTAPRARSPSLHDFTLLHS